MEEVSKLRNGERNAVVELSNTSVWFSLLLSTMNVWNIEVMYYSQYCISTEIRLYLKGAVKMSPPLALSRLIAL